MPKSTTSRATKPSPKSKRDRLAAIEATLAAIAKGLDIGASGVSLLERELSTKRMSTTRRAAMAFIADRLSDRTIEALVRMPEHESWSLNQWIETIKGLENQARAMDGAK